MASKSHIQVLPSHRRTGAAVEVFPWESCKTYLVMEDFTVKTRFPGKTVTVKTGFQHDRFSFAPDLSNARKAAVVHDWLYDGAASGHRFDDGTFCERWQADKILLDMMRQGGYRFLGPVYWFFVRIWIGNMLRDWEKPGCSHS